MGRFTLAAALLLATIVYVGHGFTIAPPSSLQSSATRRHSAPKSVHPRMSRLQMAEQQEPEAAAEEAVTEQQQDDQEDKQQKDDEQNEQEHQVEEDPEVVALKQEIADLEKTLKARERDIQYNQEKLELYSKAGYARRVAEMENMRRARSKMNSSSREVAVASVLQSFLPIMDDFEELEQKYGNDDFGKSFSALGGTLKSAFKELGVQEYSVKEGDQVNKQRITVVEEEYSDEFPKDTVIRPVAVGMELQGNVMRMAECVASLGSEQDEADAEKEGGEDSNEEEGEVEEEPEETTEE